MYHPPEQPWPIAFCITELDPGGAEWALYHLVTRLDRQKWNPHVFCLSGRGQLVEEFTHAEIQVTCLHLRRYDVRGIFRLAREFKALQPVIVQGFLFHGNLASRFAGQLAKVPLIIAGHRVAEREKRWHLRFERWTRRCVHHHVCVSSGVADHLQQQAGIAANRLTVIPNGVQAPKAPAEWPDIRSPLGIAASAPIVLAVGRLHRQKGFDLLIEAFSAVVQQHPAAKLVIVGEGPERDSLQAQIQQRHLTRSVQLIGFQPQLAPYYREAAVFALSSRWEGMPNVLLQAMAAGVPVVATQVEGVSELVCDGQTGLVVPKDDSASLSTALKQILDSPDLAKELGNRAQDIVSKEFTWERTAQMSDQTYTDLLVQLSE